MLVTPWDGIPNFSCRVEPNTKTYPYSVTNAVWLDPDEIYMMLCFLASLSPEGRVKCL